MSSIVRVVVAVALAVLFVAPAAQAKVDPLPREWHYKQSPGAANRDSVWNQLSRLVGEPASEVSLGEWVGQSTSIAENKGKVIVLDFWATWCGPCLRAVPKNNSLVEKYGDDLAFIGICAPRGGETMEQTAKQYNFGYPTAMDPGSQTAAKYGVQWFPFYVVIDQQGIIRTTGIMPSYVEAAVQKLLDEGKSGKSNKSAGKNNRMKGKPASISPTPPKGERGTPESSLTGFLEGSVQRHKITSAMHGKNPPALATTNWINSEPKSFEDYVGKVVVVDFWATWCGPCKRAVPKTNELQAKYADQGLVVLGVCHSRGAEKMQETVDQLGIEYPVCADVDGQTVDRFRTDGFPDYYIIGRDGKVFAADVKNSMVERVLLMALAQDAPGGDG